MANYRAFERLSGLKIYAWFIIILTLISLILAYDASEVDVKCDGEASKAASFKQVPLFRSLESQIYDKWLIGEKQAINETHKLEVKDSLESSEARLSRRSLETTSIDSFSLQQRQQQPQNETGEQTKRMLHILVTAIHVDKSEFPLNRLLFKLALRMAVEAVEKQLEQVRVKLSVSVRSANTCSRQYAGAIAAEEYYTRKARLFIVSGCDDSIRAVSRLASIWKVPIMTAAGFGTDLNDKSTHKTLVRVAFSMRGAVDFLFKIMKSFQWRRVNLIVDESDPNSLALKGSIEQQSREHNQEAGDFQVQPNVISLDLQMLLSPSSTAAGLQADNETSLAMVYNTRAQVTNTSSDSWPDELASRAVRDALRKSAFYSRVNVLLIPQHYLRKFMLSVYDQQMANGLYTFINMPMLLIPLDDQLDSSSVSAGSANSSRQSYVTTTGDNVFQWRSSRSTRNSEARKAFESLMSIYLKVPFSKAYVYFSNKLSTLANSEYGTTTTTTTPASVKQDRPLHHHSQTSDPLSSNKLRLDINPYSASFYDCIKIYATTLADSLRNISSEVDKATRRNLKRDLHAKIADRMRNKRFENMVTGTISINSNGDRNNDYTLDDMNQMTGRFNPVIVYKAETGDIERLSRIQWSSDPIVGPTTDTVDCNMIGTCVSKPIPRFLIVLGSLVVPLGLLIVGILYFIHKHLSMESKLVDYWWRVQLDEIEFMASRHKKANDGSLLTARAESIVSSGGVSEQVDATDLGCDRSAIGSTIRGTGRSVAKTTDGRTTVFGTTTLASSVADVCYGNISLGRYKQTKVAVKPIIKYHQSRKLMLELRTIKYINHNNLCRFVGIIIDESNPALVSEFCAKGSLREFFQNGAMVIDWTFKYSIINDITAGMLYIHSSKLGYHGRLKSSNCLISSRFVVKLSDYGPHSLYEKLDTESVDEDDLMKKQIWMAPELLNSSQAGTPKGDIYSYGLLLYEVITNNPPFFDTTKNDFIMPLKSLVSELRTNGLSEKTTPDLAVIDTEEHKIGPLVELMKSCWKNEPQQRPTSLVLGSAVKKITHGITSEKLLDNLSRRMEQYTNNLESLVDSKLATLVEEKLRTEELVYQFVPKSIASLLKEGQSIEPEAFDCVTVFYSDIVGFTSLSSESTPMEVIDILSDLYLCFDEILERHDIYKVDTIGDAYIVASGLPERNDGKHAVEIACTALELRDRLKEFKIPHQPNRRLEMRVGIHSGPCVAGIVGNLEMPKYCVFGETVTMGRFMESSGVPMKIHITEESRKLLQGVEGFVIEPRLPKVKREGLPVQTFWLERT